MHVCGHKPHGYCGSSAPKTETKTNTKNCGGGTNFSNVLNQSKTCGKVSPKPHHVHGGPHSGHVSSPHGKHTGHTVSAPVKHGCSHHGHATLKQPCSPPSHSTPHFSHAALHKGHSLLNSKSCGSAKPVISGSTCGAGAAAQKTLQLTVQSKTCTSVNYSSFSYSVANAVSSSLINNIPDLTINVVLKKENTLTS